MATVSSVAVPPKVSPGFKRDRKLSAGQRRTVVETPNTRKPVWAVEKHKKQLDGSLFAGCAPCPGACPGKMEGTRMFCARKNGGDYVTADEAEACQKTSARKPG